MTKYSKAVWGCSVVWGTLAYDYYAWLNELSQAFGLNIVWGN